MPSTTSSVLGFYLEVSKGHIVPKHIVGFVVAVCIFTLFHYGVGYGYLSEQGMEPPGYVALAILLLAANLWITEAVPLFVTSLTVLFLAIVWLVPEMKTCGMTASNEPFLSPFFSDIILLFLGGFALSAALHKRRLDEWLAVRIIERTGSSLPVLLIGIMAVTAFLSMWLSNTATAAMMLAMVLPIVGKMDVHDARRKAILLSVPFAANIGGLGTPIGSPPTAIAIQYMQDADIAPSFARWMLIGVPGVVIMLALAWAVLLLFYWKQRDRLPELQQQVFITRDRPFWITVAIVLVTVVGWMSTGSHGLSSGTISMVPLIVFFGTGVLDTQDLRSMPWDVLLMMGGGLCLGVVIDSSGLANWMVQQMPIAGLSTFALTVVFGSVACLMSSLMSNTATANLLLPIIVGMSINSASPLMIGTAFGCSLAMPLPISTPPNAMAFSSEQISVMDMVKPGMIITLTGVALALTTGYWWWKTVGMW